MKLRIIISTETADKESLLIEYPVVPKIGEWIRLTDILDSKQVLAIQKTAVCWSGERGVVQSVEYRKDEDGFYAEIYLWCED